MSHLSLIINGHLVELPDDASIDIEDTNPYLNDVAETASYAFEIPVRGNRALLGDVDDIQSDRRLISIENMPMTVFVDGIVFRTGKVATTEDQEITDRVTISMTSNARSLSDYFGNLQCREVPVKDRIQIGEMIGNVWATFSADVQLQVKTGGKTGFLSWKWSKTKQTVGVDEGDVEMELPALGFSQPGICYDDGSSDHLSNGHGFDLHEDEDSNYSSSAVRRRQPTFVEKFINVSDPYGTNGAKYCNARVCYLHYKENDDGSSSDIVDTSGNGSGQDSKYNPYLILEADRPQSGICFYVLYFLDCLFAYLADYGISYDNSELLKVEDLKRLAFFTTHCKYDLERKYPNNAGYDFTNIRQINRWLSTRNCGGQLQIDFEKSKSIGGMRYNGTYYAIGDELPDGTELRSSDFVVSNVDTQVCANIMKMYANSQNFPDTSVQDVLDSLWASFGIRFYLDQETLQVKPFFIRSLLRDSHDPIVMNGEVYTVNKQSEKITGFRMKYSAESDRKDQNSNVMLGVRDYDTDYDYVDYRNLNADLTYKEIIRKGSVSDLTLYVDRTTGNKYRVKVNADAENVSEYHPTIFEVGQFKGVEIGDCSEEMEDFVEEVSSGFQPVVFNDVNGRNERAAAGDTVINATSDQTGNVDQLSSFNAGDQEQVLAAFIDEDMWHEYCKREVQTAFGTEYADFYLKEITRTREAFDPDSTDEGISPLQNYDWGLSVALMRGGGTDATIQKYDYDYDGYGNYKWRNVAALYAMSSDCIDSWGRTYDYNGQSEGIGVEEGRFSLKIRAFINDPATGEPLCDAAVSNRGLFDVFMADYAHFLLNRKPVIIRLHCSAAELMSIRWNKRYSIGGYVGWINKIRTHITAQNGIESVEVEMFVL